MATNEISVCKKLKDVFELIGAKLWPDQWLSFGRQLGFETHEMQKINIKANLAGTDIKESVITLLEKWQQRKNVAQNQIIPMLEKALRAIERNDLATAIKKMNLSSSAIAPSCSSVPDNCFETKKSVLTKEEKKKISQMLSRNQSRAFARELDVRSTKMDDIDRDCTVNRLGDEEFICRIIEDWECRNGNSATREKLQEAFIAVERKDIVDEVFQLENAPKVSQEKSQVKLSSLSECPESSQVTFRELMIIAKKISRSEGHALSEVLNVDKTRVKEIVKICKEDKFNDVELVRMILSEWKEREGSKATKKVLKSALYDIDKIELANEVFPEI